MRVDILYKVYYNEICKQPTPPFAVRLRGGFMNSSKIRKNVGICNIIIAAVCSIVIICYLALPFFKVSLSFTLTAESVEELMEEEVTMYDGSGSIAMVDYEGMPSPDETLNEADISFENLDIKKILGEEEVTISAGVSLNAVHILGSLINDPEDTVEDILQANVDDIVDQLDETLSKVAKNAATQISAILLKEQLKSEIYNLYETDKTDAEIQAVLNRAGITDAYIEDQTKAIVDSLYADNANTDNVADSIVNTIDDFCIKLRNSGDPDFADFALSPEDKMEMKADTKEILLEIAAEDGSIDGDEIVSRLILGLLSEEEDIGYSSSVYGKQSKIAPLAAGPDEETVKDELKAKLYEYLEVDDDVVEILAIVLRVFAVILILLLLSWLYLIIKILCKLKKPNNAIKLKMPMILGWWPFLPFFLAPTIALSVLTSPGSALAEEISTEIFNYLSIDFFTSAIVAFVAAFGLFLFAVIYYRKLRKQLKRALANPVTEETPALPTDETVDLQGWENNFYTPDMAAASDETFSADTLSNDTFTTNNEIE